MTGDGERRLPGRSPNVFGVHGTPSTNEVLGANDVASEHPSTKVTMFMAVDMALED